MFGFIEHVLDYFFKADLDNFKEESDSLVKRHESPSSQDIFKQLASLKSHLNGNKIPINLNEDNSFNRIEEIGKSSETYDE